jgi:hypothetical protein
VAGDAAGAGGAAATTAFDATATSIPRPPPASDLPRRNAGGVGGVGSAAKDGAVGAKPASSKGGAAVSTTTAATALPKAALQGDPTLDAWELLQAFDK